MFESSDDYDFVPSGSSKLASLFDGSMLSNDSSGDLKYTAPKQPKASKSDLDESSKSKKHTSVILAKVVSLWKLENTDYKSLGKHGLAIIGSTDLNIFEVISYKEKNNIIARRNLNSSFKFYNQKDWFSSFYDNDNQNWLVKFNSSDDQNEFCKEIKNCGSEIIINIDTSSVETKVSNESVSKPDTFLRESMVLPKPEVSPRLSLTSDKDAEETNSDSSSSRKRANILSRMAKMGQQILPQDILKNASTDLSDSELDDSKSDHKVLPRKFKRAVPLEKHASKEEVLLQNNYLDTQVIPTQCSNASRPQSNMAGSYPQNVVTAYQPQMFTPVLMNQPLPYDGFQQFLMTQNMELKVNLAQISSKLDSVLNISNKGDIKIDDGNLKSKIKTLELRSENLLTELERYEQMYDDLQKKCKKLEKTAESQSDKIVIENLNKQIEDLKENLKRAEEKNSNYEKLESELEKYKSDIEQHKKTVEIQTLKLKDFEEFYEENKDNKNLQQTVDTLNDTVTNLQLKLKDFEEHFLHTESEKQKRIEEREQNINTFSDNIKNHMNGMYQSILANFEEDNSYPLSQIKSHVVQNMKGTTFAIIKEFKDIYKTEDASFSSQ
ncbi:FK506-binding protein 15-like [Anoplophora glabripennis]|uniref:FK506-binding protein 15-like n=1 Tax=Anoplophora glabripennis TaxID=217634 RepID=UPI000873FB03|nr:FK506-binding protein 15-like [Anoplophora glabripennis]